MPVFFDTTNDVSRTEDEGSRYEDQDAGRPFRLRHTEEPLSSERHSASIAAYAAPGLHYQPYQDEMQGDMLAGPRVCSYYIASNMLFLNGILCHCS